MKKFSTLTLSLFSIIATFAILMAGFSYLYAELAIEERYNSSLVAPDGPTETFEEMSSNISAEFSERSWPFRLVSGNLPAVETMLIVVTILAGDTLAYCVLAEEYARVKKTKKQKEEKKIARAKRAKEAQVYDDFLATYQS